MRHVLYQYFNINRCPTAIEILNGKYIISKVEPLPTNQQSRIQVGATLKIYDRLQSDPSTNLHTDFYISR